MTKEENAIKEELHQKLLQEMESRPKYQKMIMEDLENRYGILVTVDEAAEILKRDRATIYRYKEDNRVIWEKNSHIIMIYTKSLILVL